VAQHPDFGRPGERLAKTFLDGLDCEIRGENRTRGNAEIDLVVHKDKVTIFAEVKNRTARDLAGRKVL
jgi:Holliday junction resolvase-like predicted endonuclease